MTRLALVRCGAGASILAGACWVIKSVGILVTGSQPPALFEFSFLLLPVALVGLYAALGRRPGKLAVCGLVLAIAAEASAVAVGLAWLLGPSDWLPQGEAVTVLTPLVVLASLGTFAALLLLGVAAFRASAFPGRWRALPLSFGVSAIPLLIMGGALEAVNERLLEVPLMIMGIAWMALGVVMGKASGRVTG
jgi:hypothetical protein